MLGRLKFWGKKDSTEEITSAIKSIQDGIENTDTFQKVKNELQNLCNRISTKESEISVNNTSVVGSVNVGSANVSNANVSNANVVGSANVGSSANVVGNNARVQYGGKRKTKKRSRRSKSKPVLTVSRKTRKNRKSSNRTRKISRKIQNKKRSQKSKKVPLTKKQIQLNIIARYYKKKYQNSKAQKRRYRRNVNLKKYVKQKSKK